MASWPVPPSPRSCSRSHSRPPAPAGRGVEDRCRRTSGRLQRWPATGGGCYDAGPRCYVATPTTLTQRGGAARLRLFVASVADHRVDAVVLDRCRADRRGAQWQLQGQRRRGDRRRAPGLGASVRGSAPPSCGFVIAEGAAPGSGNRALTPPAAPLLARSVPRLDHHDRLRRHAPASRQTAARLISLPRWATCSCSPGRADGAHRSCSRSMLGPCSPRTSACAGPHRTVVITHRRRTGPLGFSADGGRANARGPRRAGGSRGARRRRPAHREQGRPPGSGPSAPARYATTTIAGDGGEQGRGLEMVAVGSRRSSTGSLLLRPP